MFIYVKYMYFIATGMGKVRTEYSEFAEQASNPSARHHHSAHMIPKTQTTTTTHQLMSTSSLLEPPPPPPPPMPSQYHPDDYARIDDVILSNSPASKGNIYSRRLFLFKERFIYPESKARYKYKTYLRKIRDSLYFIFEMSIFFSIFHSNPYFLFAFIIWSWLYWIKNSFFIYL